MILIRFILIGLIVFLIARSFSRYRDGEVPSANQDGTDKNGKKATKKVSKQIGEYVDYEEIKK